MKKQIIGIIGGIIGFVLLVFLVFFFWYKISLMPVNKTGKEIQIEIPLGSSSTKIVEILKQNDAIRSEFATKIYLFLHKGLSFQAGLYKIDNGNTTKEILEQITKGKILKDSISVTLIPGKKITNYIETLSKSLSINQEDFFETLKDEDFLKELIEEYWFLTDEILDERLYYSLEGYLLPDTYEFKKEITAKEVLERILSYTKTKLEGVREEINTNGYSVHEILSMAAIAEKEANSLEDRKSVAQVIYKRLSLHMGLGMDVTTYYAVKKEIGMDLTYDDLDTNSPYNTSERNPSMAGKLPVGPICNPSMDSINAVLHPNTTDYLYFFANIDTGKVCFTKTYSEHQKVIKEGCK